MVLLLLWSKLKKSNLMSNDKQTSIEELAKDYADKVIELGWRDNPNVSDIIRDFKAGYSQSPAKDGVRWVKASMDNNDLPTYKDGDKVFIKYFTTGWTKETGTREYIIALLENGWQELYWLSESPSQPVAASGGEDETYGIEWTIDGLTKEQYDEWMNKIKDAGFTPVTTKKP
jgi:hypothetical protein